MTDFKTLRVYIERLWGSYIRKKNVPLSRLDAKYSILHQQRKKKY